MEVDTRSSGVGCLFLKRMKAVGSSNDDVKYVAPLVPERPRVVDRTYDPDIQRFP